MKIGRDRFDRANKAESDVRDAARKDRRFRTGDQWEPKARQIREDEDRPCLTLNLIPKFLHQLTNEQRQQQASMQVSPLGNATSAMQYSAINTEPRDAADIWQGLLRHIELRSDADIAYDCAFDAMVGDSFGWWEITAEYAGLDTFDQELKIQRILDPFAVYSDPNAVQPDRADMRWAFTRSSLTQEEFKRQHPESKMVSMNFFTEVTGGPGEDWVGLDTVQLAKYWEITTRPRELQLVSTPSDQFHKMVDAFKRIRIQPNDQKDGTILLKAFADEYETLPAGCQIKQTRPVDWPRVRWHLITGSDILDEGEWPGQWIPLIPTFGEEIMQDGKRMLISMTRFLRDPQILYNFFRSQQAEVIALTPKAPWVGAVGQFRTKRRDWQQANQKNYAYLEYDPVAVGEKLEPPPQRNTAEAPIQGLNQACAQASEEMNAVSGVYPPALGQASNETSGRAIFERKTESDTANFHFLDAFKRSIRHQGKILLDLIPHYYDRKGRIIRIVKPDSQQELVTINAPTTYNGKPAFFDPDVGEFDMDVNVGPSYQSALRETFEMLTQFVQANPALLNVVGDLIFRASPLPGTIGIEAADRMKALLDPRVAAIAQGDQPIDAATQAKLAQSSQQIQLLTQKLTQLADVLRTKKMELESKERIANVQAEAGILEAMLKAKFAQAEGLAERDFAAIQHRMDLLNNQIGIWAEQMGPAAPQNQPQPEPQPQAA